MDQVAVLIPCYNESSTIGKVVRDFREALPEAVMITILQTTQIRLPGMRGLWCAMSFNRGRGTWCAVCLRR